MTAATRVRKSLVAGAAVAMVGLGALAAEAPSASASYRDGYCQSGEFCYFYNSIDENGPSGSGSDFIGSISNYGTDPATCYTFRSPGNGQGQCIKNNAASVWNRTSHPVRVFYNSGYSGAYVTVPAGGWGNLPMGIKNQNASHKFL